MKSFLLVEHQSGGCDYTIGCGIRTSIIRAESMQHALQMVHADLNVGDNESAIDDATLYEIADTAEINIPALRAERMEQDQRERDEETLREKRELLKRLKEELGDD